MTFNKYQGTGNDFIIIDNRKAVFNPGDSVLVSRLCDRRLGIGADGLILIEEADGFDFRMTYFNSDGFEGSMCGNGGRCAAHFAFREGIAGKKLIFTAVDGSHEASEEDDSITLQMNDVKDTGLINGNYFINTGSPHYIVFSENVAGLDVYSEGRRLRWSENLPPGGANINFVEVKDNHIFVRTFERGVEDETLSCGTGVTASAIASVLAGHFDSNSVNIVTKGGNLNVEFIIEDKGITNIRLTGPATFVFKGEIEI
ncbi:MAG: diaminopimelate epimerase [Bacteroidales bacterium]|nr:diaminopimelate epimerase [Bacteroidales bacterium]